MVRPVTDADEVRSKNRVNEYRYTNEKQRTRRGGTFGLEITDGSLEHAEPRLALLALLQI